MKLKIPMLPMKSNHIKTAGAKVYPTLSVPNLWIENRTTNIATEIIITVSAEQRKIWTLESNEKLDKERKYQMYKTLFSYLWWVYHQAFSLHPPRKELHQVSHAEIHQKCSKMKVYNYKSLIQDIIMSMHLIIPFRGTSMEFHFLVNRQSNFSSCWWSSKFNGLIFVLNKNEY